jgi:hypothetical protein
MAVKSTATSDEVLSAVRNEVRALGTGDYPVAADWTLFNRIGRRVGIDGIETRDRETRDRLTGQVRRALYHLADEGALIRISDGRMSCYYSPAAHELMLSRQAAATAAPEVEVRLDLSAGLLEEFKVLQSSDPVKRDLELTHIPCGEHLCDVEPDDTIAELAFMIASHICGGRDAR